MEAEEDNMAKTALTFILLFIITLLFTIGSTTFKVTIRLNESVVHRFGFDLTILVRQETKEDCNDSIFVQNQLWRKYSAIPQ